MSVHTFSCEINRHGRVFTCSVECEYIAFLQPQNHTLATITLCPCRICFLESCNGAMKNKTSTLRLRSTHVRSEAENVSHPYSQIGPGVVQELSRVPKGLQSGSFRLPAAVPSAIFY